MLLPILLPHHKIVTNISLHLGHSPAKRTPHLHLDCNIPTNDRYQMRSGQQSRLRFSILPRDRLQTCWPHRGSNSQHWWSSDHESCAFPLNHACIYKYISIFFLRSLCKVWFDILGQVLQENNGSGQNKSVTISLTDGKWMVQTSNCHW